MTPSRPRLRGWWPRADVTVVVPVHDTAPYVLDCLRSIEAQRSGCDVVVVDDGSTDGSLDLIRSWAGTRRGVTVITQENRGPGGGAARNVGFDHARTEWVLFLDSDDVLAHGAIAALVRGARHGSDLVVGRVESFPEKRPWAWDPVFSSLAAPETHPITKVGALVHNPAPGNKLFRRSAMLRRGLRFAEAVHHQDTVVSVPMMLLSRTVTVVPDLVLRYRQRPGSVMSRHFERPENYTDHLQVAEELLTMLQDLEPARRELLDAFLARSMQGFVLRAHQLDAPVRADFLRRAATLFRHVDRHVIGRSTADLEHRRAYASLLGEAPLVDVELTADGGALFARADLDPLTRLGPVMCHLAEVEGTEDALLVRGTLALPGIPGPATLSGVTFGLRIRGAGTTVPMTVSRSDDQEDAPAQWKARVPMEHLVPGGHAIRVVVETPTGQASAAVRPPIDASLPWHVTPSVDVLADGRSTLLRVAPAPERHSTRIA